MAGPEDLVSEDLGFRGDGERRGGPGFGPRMCVQGGSHPEAWRAQSSQKMMRGKADASRTRCRIAAMFGVAGANRSCFLVRRGENTAVESEAEHQGFSRQHG